jgi:guanylate kinase
VTTRPPRPGEKDGVDYRFIDESAFRAMVDAEQLLENARVFGHHYGTPKTPVDEALASGRDVLFDIDWQGTQQLKASARDDLASVFVLPPSMAELEQRLKSRAQDSAEVVADRMAMAADEMSHWPEYDYIIVNSDIEESVNRAYAILAAERSKRDRQTGLAEFVKRLRES